MTDLMCKRKIRATLLSSSDGREMCLTESTPDSPSGSYHIHQFGSTRVINMDGEYVEIIATGIVGGQEEKPQAPLSSSFSTLQPLLDTEQVAEPANNPHIEQVRIHSPAAGASTNEKSSPQIASAVKVLNPPELPNVSSTSIEGIALNASPPSRRAQDPKVVAMDAGKGAPNTIHPDAPHPQQNLRKRPQQPIYESIFAGITLILLPLIVVPPITQFIGALILLALAIIGTLGIRLLLSLGNMKYYSGRDVMALVTIGPSIAVFFMGPAHVPHLIGVLALIPLPWYLGLLIYEGYLAFLEKKND